MTPSIGSGHWVQDETGKKYLDLYGGHGVISVGHSHPHYVKKIQEQLSKLGYYSNAVTIPLQNDLSQKLEHVAGIKDYGLFLCNSGAEAVENCLRIASLDSQKAKIICFEGAFHGRTALTMALGDHPQSLTAINKVFDIIRLPLNDIDALNRSLDPTVAAVVIEGIQGIGGVHEGSQEFWTALETLCGKHQIKLIADEVQSGYGRTGEFFAFQHYGVTPDLIAMAKGMGNGFPLAGVLAKSSITLKSGDLGSTFGGNPLACAAGLAVLEIIDQEKLIANAQEIGAFLQSELKSISGVLDVRGKGLMLGIQLNCTAKEVHTELLQKGIICGTARPKDTLRILPPLGLNLEEAKLFIQALSEILAPKSALKLKGSMPCNTIHP
jgi:acetylornithine aminotransferase